MPNCRRRSARPAGREERKGRREREDSEEGRRCSRGRLCSGTAPAFAWRNHGKPRKPGSRQPTLGRSPECQMGVLTTQPTQLGSLRGLSTCFTALPNGDFHIKFVIFKPIFLYNGLTINDVV